MQRQRNSSILLFLVVTLWVYASCTRSYTAPGPPGRDGRIFFGIDYDYQHPYSYWDNNPDVPNNPIPGNYHLTHSGTYDFEYFINPTDYWYGTYTLWANAGGPGGPHGRPGIDGMDTYLMLICNPEGYYEERFESYKKETPLGKQIIVEGANYRIVMYKTNTMKRPQAAKAIVPYPTPER